MIFHNFPQFPQFYKDQKLQNSFRIHKQSAMCCAHLQNIPRLGSYGVCSKKCRLHAYNNGYSPNTPMFSNKFHNFRWIPQFCKFSKTQLIVLQHTAEPGKYKTWVLWSCSRTTGWCAPGCRSLRCRKAFRFWKTLFLKDSTIPQFPQFPQFLQFRQFNISDFWVNVEKNLRL